MVETSTAGWVNRKILKGCVCCTTVDHAIFCIAEEDVFELEFCTVIVLVDECMDEEVTARLVVDDCPCFLT